VDVRVLIDNVSRNPVVTDPSDLPSDDRLRSLYGPPRLPWLRVNMISTLDGAATGAGGKSGDINNSADKRVFDTLRALADVIVVGAGTARIEEYGVASAPIAVVSRRAEIPAGLREAPTGKVILVTCARADGLPTSREMLGEDQVIVVGDDAVDLRRMRAELVDRGFQNLHSEGGPHLLADLLASGVVDELCVSVVPHLVSGPYPRIAVGPGVNIDLDLLLLLEGNGTLLGRWAVSAT
jgi:riboflavin biosynthesis pyrimidine reductase